MFSDALCVFIIRFNFHLRYRLNNDFLAAGAQDALAAVVLAPATKGLCSGYVSYGRTGDGCPTKTTMECRGAE